MNVAIKYKPHNYIRPFHEEREKYFIRAIVTGFGGGKTYAGCMELIQCSAINKGVPNIYIEPTNTMIKDILEPELISILEANSIPYYWNKTDHNFTLPLWDGIIWLRSGDKPVKLKGRNAGIVGIDEPFIQDEEVFKIALSRARNPKARVKGIFLTGTPEQLNWGYEILVTDVKDDTKIYKGTTLDNIQYVGQEYVDNLRRHYSEKEVMAYVYGHFVNLTSGLVYYAFSNDNIIDSFDYMPYRPLEISCDFNIDLMTWNISQEKEGKDYVFDYVELQGQANTELMCSMLKSKYASHPGGFHFYGDIAGNQRHPEASRTNWTIIRDEFPGAQIDYQKIENIKDRVDSTNARFKNSRNEISCYITKNCKRLIKDLQYVNWDTLLTKNKALLLTHASDGLSYMMHWKYPRIGKPTVRQYHLK